MRRVQTFRSTAAVLAGAAVVAQGALAGGEPKHDPPFTRPASAHHPLQRSTVSTTADPVIQGERKNELPFTRHVA